MGTFEFALGELKCGRLPWFSWWVWAGVIMFILDYSWKYHKAHDIRLYAIF